MRKDSELFLKKLLEYRKKVGKDSFEVIYQDYKEIPSIETAIFDILKDLIKNNCLTSQSRVLDLEGHISINLTLDGIAYFDEAKTKENTLNYIFNVSGGQMNFAKDNGTINAVVNNDSRNDYEQQKIKSRTQEYADKWNANMFLNDFNKRDKNAGVNIKLKAVYRKFHLPHYIWKTNRKDKPSTNLNSLLSEYTKRNYDKKMLLILGQPGIGKSTLITWITANFINIIDRIMVYQFASDLKNVEWKNASEGNNVVDRILDVLNLSYGDLNGKILIIDGFDEISVGNNRERILNQLYWKLIKENRVDNFSLLITCRENYITNLYTIECDYITLLPWNKKQIQSFCSVFQNISKSHISSNTMKNILNNSDVLGIPLILYMVLALKISIENEGSIVDVYDQIFSLNGGIYDRCINNVRYADFHRISEIKKQIHQISQGIAIWMFENNADKATICQEEYEKICDLIKKKKKTKNIKQDFLIGNYFSMIKHCEGIGTDELSFVHRSIYEYFVSETIYNSIKSAILSLSKESQEEFARNIAVHLKQGEITHNIGEYLHYKIIKLYKNLDIDKRERFYLWWEMAIGKMMDCGMFYCAHNKLSNYNNILTKQIICWMNLINILRLLLDTSNKRYILEWVNQRQVIQYIAYYIIESRIEEKINAGNLSRVYLGKANLEMADLEEINLSESYLQETNLRRARLIGTNLKGTILKKANLCEADLEAANLEEAYCGEAIFIDANLRKANLEGADLYKADLRGAYLGEATLRGVNLEASIWNVKDIQKFFSKLQDAKFTYILVEDKDSLKKVSRKELFNFRESLL